MVPKTEALRDKIEMAGKREMEDMRGDFFTDRAFRVVIIICFSVVAFSIFYYLVLFLPMDKRAQRAVATKERLELEARKAKTLKDYDECRAEAMAAHVSDWDRACRVYGKSGDCGLPRPSSERLDRLFREAKEECFRRHLYDR